MKAKDLIDNVQVASVIVALLLGIATIIGSLYRRYQMTLGRRRVLTARLRKPSCHMQVDYLEYVLGVAAFRKNVDQGAIYIWSEPEYYVQALVRDEVTMALSITTRTRRFKPTLFKGYVISDDGNTLQVKLGKTPFSRLAYDPSGIGGFVGARLFSYSEVYWYGNPGNYQYWIYSLNQAGFVSKAGWALIERVNNMGDFSLGVLNPGGGQDTEISQFLNDPRMVRARKRARLNTLTTTASNINLAELASEFEFGPDPDYVRLVQSPQSFSRFRRLVRLVRSRMET